MHDCKRTQEKLLDLAFGELAAGEKARVLAEISVCTLCRAEFESLCSTLDFYGEAAQLDEPTEHYWQQYEARLLANFQPKKREKSVSKSFWQQLFFSSISVPVPVAAGAILIVFAATLFAVRSSKTEPQIIETKSATIQTQVEPQIIVQEKPVDRVVWRERTVTQKVYVIKESRREKQLPNQIFARTRKAENSNFNQINLAEFKPAIQAVPRVVKGDESNDK